MKKMSFVMVLVALLAVVTLTGCNKEKTAKGYGLVHKDYVGVATITVEKDVVTALEFEEVYLPSHWAGLTTTEGVSEDLYVTYTNSKGKAVNVAKYIVVGGKTFTATPVEKDVKYSSSDIADLKAWIKEAEANAKWYAEEVMAGNAKVVDANGAAVTFETTAAKEGGFIKSTTGYWSGDKYPLGWKGNMEALSKAFVGTSMDLNVENFVKATEGDKNWTFDGIVSTATLTDAKDYYQVALNAYNTATK